MVDGQEMCTIMVSKVPQSDKDGDASELIIFGSMFFQAVYAQITYQDSGGFGKQRDIAFFKNKNALTATYCGDQTYPLGVNAFTPNSYTLVPLAQQDGLPTFAAQIEGINATVHPNSYFYLDFSAIRSVAWGVNCTHDAMGTYLEGPCYTKPTLMSNVFNGTGLPH